MPKTPKTPARGGSKLAAALPRTLNRPQGNGWRNLSTRQGGKGGKPPRFPGRTGGR